MTIDDVENAKKWGSWNPFRTLEGQQEATSAARAGAELSGFVSVFYAVQVAFYLTTGSDTFGNAGAQTLLLEIAGMVGAAFVTWRILVAQSLWAAVVASTWFWLTLVATVFAGLHGQTSKIGWGIGLALIFDSISSVRGSWKLRSLRRRSLAKPDRART
jgi:hypothetical protein